MCLLVKTTHSEWTNMMLLLLQHVRNNHLEKFVVASFGGVVCLCCGFKHTLGVYTKIVFWRKKVLKSGKKYLRLVISDSLVSKANVSMQKVQIKHLFLDK